MMFRYSPTIQYGNGNSHIHSLRKIIHVSLIDQLPEGISQCNEAHPLPKIVGKTTQLAAHGIPAQSAREDLHHATAEHLCRKGCIFVARIGRDSKWNMQLRKLPPFSISRTSSCYLEAARFLALIRSNGYVLVEPEKCLEPSLLTSTDSHVFWQEDSREQRGCTTQTLIPSLCRIQVAKRGTSFAILQLTRFTLHWDPTQTSYKNAKLRPKKHACELC